MKWIFQRKQRKKEIYDLLKGEKPDIRKNIVLYIGNGADHVDTSEKVYHNLGGRHDICVATYLKWRRECSVKKIDFSNPDGVFLGYILRTKQDGAWKWYGNDNVWHPLSADMPEMKLFQAGDVLPIQKVRHPGTYILEARWRSPEGKNVNCGYPMFRNRLMAHALGGLDGKTYHNTLTAFDAARKHNYRYYELDLTMTSDKRLILSHGWTKARCKTTGMEYSKELENATYDQVMAKTAHGNPLMDARDFYRIMKQYPEYVFEIDFHGLSAKEMKIRMELLLNDMNGDKEVLDRMLIQSYSKSMYEGTAKTYPFKYHQYLVGKNIHKVDEIIDYAIDNGICALALRMNHAKPALVKKIKNAGLYTLAYTVNSDLAVANKLLESGVDTLCTDFITPRMLEESNDSFRHYPFYVYYHAGTKEAESDYPDAKLLDSGIYEYKDQELWENDGTRSLKKCRFRVEGKQFAGWNLRVHVENVAFWYGTDHMYHCKGDTIEAVKVNLETFSDEQQLPVLTVKKNMRLVMVATWK